jgi:hypothetical protein
MELAQLIDTVWRSEESDFYRKKWGSLPATSQDVPHTGISDIVNCPIDERLYLKRGLFVKIGYHEDTPYLIARTKEDIGAEAFGSIRYERPLIYFESAQESVEKSLWQYAQNILPLIAEDSFDITCMAAERYGIDAVMGDVASLVRLSKRVRDLPFLRSVKHLTAVDSRFDPSSTDLIRESFPDATLELTLALPETGSLGHACENTQEGKLHFHSAKDTLLECADDGMLIATRLALLPTPILRYDTGMQVRPGAACAQNDAASFLLV